MSQDRLWSPQMRKWVRDAPQHGFRVKFETRGKREAGSEGGGTVPRLLHYEYYTTEDSRMIQTEDRLSFYWTENSPRPG